MVKRWLPVTETVERKMHFLGLKWTFGMWFVYFCAVGKVLPHTTDSQALTNEVQQ